MDLPVTLYNGIVDFLTSLPNIDDIDTQRVIIYRAGLEQELQTQISFSKPSAQFASLLVATLVGYGILKDGRNALESVLEAAKHFVGSDGKKDCDALIQELQVHSKEQKQISSNQLESNSKVITTSDITPSENQHQLKVFLCHSSTDKPIVRKLYQKLHAEGIAPWIDEEDLLPGQDWQQEIPKVVRAADVVLVCLSQNSITKAGYVQKEIKHALDIADEQPEGEIFIIPVRLEECKVPERLSRWHWVNLFEENGYAKLMRALKTRAENLGVALKGDTSQLEYDPELKKAHNILQSIKVNFPAIYNQELSGLDKTFFSLNPKLSGQWKGHWNSLDPEGEWGGIILNIYQINNILIGTSRLDNSSLSIFGEIYLKGEVSNDKIAIKLLIGNVPTEYFITGDLEEDKERLSISGNYIIIGYDHGNFKVEKNFMGIIGKT